MNIPITKGQTRNIKLEVIDEINATASMQQNIYMYDAEVDFPNEEENNITLLGIDTDQDGIRDDLQNWISKKAGNQLSLKNAYKKLASNFAIELKNSTNLTLINNLFNEDNRIKNCIRSFYPSDEISSVNLASFEMSFFNTDERAKESFKIDSLNAGKKIESYDETKIVEYCTGL